MQLGHYHQVQNPPTANGTSPLPLPLPLPLPRRCRSYQS
jgi:hypothetical protein